VIFILKKNLPLSLANGNCHFGKTNVKKEKIMDRERAKEIMNSPETIYVTYQNIPVWLDQLKDNNQIQIRDMNADIWMDVPLNELMEIETLDYQTNKNLKIKN
jgi:H-type small acid-soluble spore protein